jgi:hypothetical protein
MKIFNHFDLPYSFDERLKPLFEAMKSGKIVKSVTCIERFPGESRVGDNFTIKNFNASEYYVDHFNIGSNTFDYVRTDKEKSFYINWVDSFEL